MKLQAKIWLDWKCCFCVFSKSISEPPSYGTPIHYYFYGNTTWDNVFKNGSSNVCGRQPLNWSEWSLQVFLKLSCKSFAWSILFNTWSHIFCLLSLVENSRRESVKLSKIFFSLRKYPLKLIKFWWRLDQKNIRVYIEPICKSTGYIEKTI